MTFMVSLSVFFWGYFLCTLVFIRRNHAHGRAAIAVINAAHAHATDVLRRVDYTSMSADEISALSAKLAKNYDLVGVYLPDNIIFMPWRSIAKAEALALAKIGLGMAA